MFITLPSVVLEKVRTDSAVHANTILCGAIVVSILLSSSLLWVHAAQLFFADLVTIAWVSRSRITNLWE
jgi:hypothetical protein